MISDTQNSAANTKTAEKIIKRAPNLIITLVEGNALAKDQQIVINPFGVTNHHSQRLNSIVKPPLIDDEEEKIQGDFLSNSGDFTTYFGSYDVNELMKNDVVETGKLNDYILPKSEGFGKRHFMIYFSVEKNGYFIKDAGEGLGTFIRIDQ